MAQQDHPLNVQNSSRNHERKMMLSEPGGRPSQHDAAGGAYTKEAEEADSKADDHFVDREAAPGEEDYDCAAAVKSSGTNIISLTICRAMWIP
ncbi:hypothetical protein KIN20_010926 [Parelaphostrongylus tenuis]|uniref:Uncharacterized protein n=1 Tax=Parelaphostrongylus tenuis TaxID=148309 RepID=A0AAD5MDA2_PARTN|nr:hypothetical protein KIN20_010926 [Parelaphostrongylus tenuis]